MSTRESIAYVPTRAEARALAAQKSPDVILDKADLAALTRGLDALEERRSRAARGLAHMGDEITTMRDQLELLRLQLKK